MWSGCGTALVTPFRADLSLDEAAMRRLVRRQVDAGINFLVPCGTTGENPTLNWEETLRVVEITVEEAVKKKGTVPDRPDDAADVEEFIAPKLYIMNATIETVPPLLKARPQGLLLITDELSLGLAPVIIDEVYETLATIRDSGTALLIVEQHVHQALSLADDVVVLAKGSVTLSGRADELGDVTERLMPAAHDAPPGTNGSTAKRLT